MTTLESFNLPLRGKRIFIIEDNVRNRAIMQMLIEQAGAKTSIERWGTNVVERLKAFAPIDVILLDLMFPDEITGYDVFDLIREVEEFLDVPIVAVSATDPTTAVPRCKELGFSGFIRKPVDFQEFPRQIAAILAGHEIWFSVDLYELELDELEGEVNQHDARTNH